MRIGDNLKGTAYNNKVVSLILLGIIFTSITLGYTSFLNSFVIATDEYQTIEVNAMNSDGEKSDTFSQGEYMVLKTKFSIRGAGSSIYYSEFLVPSSNRDVPILIEIIDDQENIIYSETDIVNEAGYSINQIPIPSEITAGTYQVKLSSSNKEESSFNIFIV